MKPKNSGRSFIFNIFSANERALIVFSFVFVFSILYFTFFTPNYYHGNAPLLFEIKKGTTLDQISDSLQKKGVIGSRFVFKVSVLLSGADKKIKAGTYRVPNGLSYLELVSLFSNGSPSEQVFITIPEGIWQPDLAALMKQKLKIDSALFTELSYDKSFLRKLGIDSPSIEGYLLPESYYFYTHSSAEEVLTKLKYEMDKFFTPARKSRMAELGMTMHQVLTLASIIEGETNRSEDFKLISGVYHNRLKKGMLLQACPTVQYLIRDKRVNRILYKDLEIESPYNTYKNIGLPPGPINNPGKEAIEAALYPAKHNYLYFVADGTGGHRYSTNYDQHLQYTNQYREWSRIQ